MAASILVTITQTGDEGDDEVDVQIEENVDGEEDLTPTPIMAVPAEGEAEVVVVEEPSNPILPTTNELFWGASVFFVLWALMKFVFLPPIVKVMKERNDKIRADLEAGEHAKAQADVSVADYEASLTSARAEASRIIEDARAQADAQRRDIMAAAEAEVAELRQQAAAEVAAAKEAALAELRSSVASIAVGAAEAVVAKRLDEAAQLRVIEDYVNRAGSAN